MDSEAYGFVGEECDGCCAVFGICREDHTFADVFTAHHCTGRKIHDDTDVFTDQHIGLIPFCDARHDGAFAFAVKYGELEKLFAFLDIFAICDLSNAKLDLAEVVKTLSEVTSLFR